MNNTALMLIIISNFTLVLILGVLVFLIYKMFKNQLTPKDGLEYHPEVLKRMKEAKKIKPKRTDLFCPNHQDEPGEVTCGICDKLFCKSCAKAYKNLHFCSEHLPLITNNEWNEVVTIKTSTQDPEEGVRLYGLKKKMFEEDEIPSYIETHYKINVDHDFIETYLVLFALPLNVDEMKSRLLI